MSGLTREERELCPLTREPCVTAREQAAYERGRAEGAAGVRARVERALRQEGHEMLSCINGHCPDCSPVRDALDADPSPSGGDGEVGAMCACGRMSLATTVSERHDRGLHAADRCIGAWGIR